MCLVFLNYYPKLSLAKCLSHPEKTTGFQFYKYVTQNGWSAEQKVKYQKFVSSDVIVNKCKANNKDFPVRKNII